MRGRPEQQEHPGPVPPARGGVSLAAVLTGVVVAIGAFFLLSALVGGVLSIGGIDAEDLAEGTDAGVGAGIALIVAFFLAYVWGGYTAGRMGRGAGVLNGLLVPLLALLVGAAVGAVVVALGSTAELNLPFSTNRLPLEEDYVVDWTIGLGVATLVAMFLGGIIGGMLGSRWHTKLERKAAAERERQTPEERDPYDGHPGEGHLPDEDGRGDHASDRHLYGPGGPAHPGDEDAATREIHIERHPSVGGAPPPPPPPPRTTGPPPPPPDDGETREMPPS